MTGERAQRARQMQDSEIKKGGGTRTPQDRDTAFRLGTGTSENRPSHPERKGLGGNVNNRSTYSRDLGKGNAAKRKIAARGGPPGYQDTSRTKPMGEAYSDVYERLNPFQVTFDKDGNEEDRKKRDSTPEAKAADAKRAKIASERKQPDPYKARAGESD